MTLIKKPGQSFIFELPANQVPVSKVVTLNVFPSKDEATQVEVTVPFSALDPKAMKSEGADVLKEVKEKTEKMVKDANEKVAAAEKDAKAIIDKANDEAKAIVGKAKKKNN